jgi:hypothetical protein
MEGVKFARLYEMKSCKVRVDTGFGSPDMQHSSATTRVSIEKLVYFKPTPILSIKD